MQANEHKNEYTKKDAVNMLKRKPSENKKELIPTVKRALIVKSVLEAEKVDFLTSEEVLYYAKVLYEAKLWGMTVK